MYGATIKIHYIYLHITFCRTGCGFDTRPVNTQSERMLRSQSFVLEGEEVTRYLTWILLKWQIC